MGGGDKKKAEEGLTGVGEGIQKAAAVTPEEQQQYKGSFDIGNFLKQLEMYQMGGGEAPQGYQDPTQQFLRQGGEVGQNYYNQILSESKDPYANYESSLRPALQQAQDATNQYYQSRGLLNSGLAIEGMGRAGVDLAIKEASGRMQARQQSMGEVSDFLNYTQGAQQQNIGNLTNLYGQQQSAGQNALGRQSQGYQAAGQYMAAPYTAQLGGYYGRQAALNALPGQLIGAAGTAIGGAVGGPLGAAAGSQLGGFVTPTAARP